jgi:CRP-like cAMP-binding protein
VGERRLIRLDTDDTIRALDRIPLFAECSPREMRDIADRAQLVAFDGGQVIVREGEAGETFYLIVSGSATVSRRGHEIARLQQGDFFGEESLLEWTPRSASVQATGSAVCLALPRADFRAILVRNPRLALRILEEEARRVESRDTMPGAPE